MQTKFKRGQKVKLKVAPDPEYIEYHTENTGEEKVPITAGMMGKINIILPNGQYHVEILDSEGREFAYAPFDEEFLEAID
tara:strand:+ start:2545 stop:2784 length:240 start_codon:yes stop_codon:yes gene_type:complete